MRPFLDIDDPEDISRLHQLASDLYDEVTAVGGTISAQHGDGLSRSWFLRKHSGTVFPVYRELKTIFDPDSILNPAKIADSHLHRPTQNIRMLRRPTEAETFTTAERYTAARQRMLPRTIGSDQRGSAAD